MAVRQPFAEFRCSSVVRDLMHAWKAFLSRHAVLELLILYQDWHLAWQSPAPTTVRGGVVHRCFVQDAMRGLVPGRMVLQPSEGKG